jgi:hypothetical protein
MRIKKEATAKRKYELLHPKPFRFKKQKKADEEEKEKLKDNRMSGGIKQNRKFENCENADITSIIKNKRENKHIKGIKL